MLFQEMGIVTGPALYSPVQLTDLRFALALMYDCVFMLHAR